MAVEQWELDPQHPYERDGAGSRPSLALVPPPARPGRVVPALLFLALIAATLGYPAVSAATKEQPAPAAWTPRGPGAAQVTALDPMRPLPKGARPTSSEPAGGVLFVRCTNLWTALPDGTHPRKLLDMPGISSPAFSPDARSIAFVGPGSRGQSFYLASADGSRVTELGTFSENGIPIAARVTNLTWSPRGKKLAFALVDPSHDAWSGGSTIWSYELRSGELERVGEGWPAPAFLGRNGVVYADWVDNHKAVGPTFTSPARAAARTAKRLSSDGDELTLAMIPDNLSEVWSMRGGVVVLRRNERGSLELVVRRSIWRPKVLSTHPAPSPYQFFPQGRVSLSQDSRRAVADLVDPHGGRAVGVLDVASGEWTVLDHAWSGVASPTPATSGPLAAARAAGFASDILGSRSRTGAYTAAALLLDDDDDRLMRPRRGGHILGTPVRSEGGWTFPATLHGADGGAYRFQHGRVTLRRASEGRVRAVTEATSGPRPLKTVGDARRFVEEVLGENAAWPRYLPAGVALDEKWPVDAYSWDGSSVVTVRFALPREEGKRGRRTMGLSFGDVSFELGCGGENDPEEGEVGGEPALFDRIGAGRYLTRQVLWPATLEARDAATSSVFGGLSRLELERIAASMSS